MVYQLCDVREKSYVVWALVLAYGRTTGAFEGHLQGHSGFTLEEAQGYILSFKSEITFGIKATFLRLKSS